VHNGWQARTSNRALGRAAALVIAMLSTGCGSLEGIQSALQPQGISAQSIATVWWIMFWGACAILLLVMVLAIYALRRPKPSRLGHPYLIIGGGLVFPIVTLTALLTYGLSIGHEFHGGAAAPAPLRIEVIGKRWWWEVRYRNGPSATPIVSANEIHLPVGVPVEFAVSTSDVIHSLWIPSLAGKIDMVPGKVNRVRIQADTPGVYRGQCAEYCGTQHTWMAFYVVAHTPDEFEAWLANEQRHARVPSEAFLQRGRNAFVDAGCGACHRIRGVEQAFGALGPDLTHVGSRRSLGAGTIDNHVGTLAGWIADSHAIKPGNLMPPFAAFDGETLRALAAYLESLQ
jgi:cytochrome c oxidase subunit 2